MKCRNKIVPVALAVAIGFSPMLAQAQETYTVKSGDTLWGIGRDNNISVETIKKINSLKSNVLIIGQKILLAPETTDTGKNLKIYSVKNGDTLYGIALDNSVTINDIKKWNSLKSNVVFIGQKLTIKGSVEEVESSGTKTESSLEEDNEEKTESKKLVHTAKRGDTLFGIARTYKVSLKDLKEWNNLSSYNLLIGQKISINGSEEPEMTEDVEPEVATIKSGEVTATLLNMRSGAGLNYTTVGGLKKGTIVTIIDEKDAWSNIKYNGSVSWVFSNYLKVITNDEEEEHQSKNYEINATKLNIRKGPSTDDDILLVLPRGTVVAVIEEKGEWSKILYENKIGWVSSQYISGEKNVAPPNGKVVLLDAGHGGSDPGAVVSDNTKEEDITLAIALKTEQALIDQGYKVEMVRTTSQSCTSTGSVTIELQCRVSLSKTKKADIFISIHANTANVSARGTETFYSTLNQHPNDSAKLANAIHTKYQQAFGSTDRKVKTSNFYVLRYNTIPSVLLEIGFMSDVSDLIRLKSTSVQGEVAKGIASGVNDYFGFQQ
jgi:N-acetylmuramoyl-L-alanine amidase